MSEETGFGEESGGSGGEVAAAYIECNGRWEGSVGRGGEIAHGDAGCVIHGRARVGVGVGAGDGGWRHLCGILVNV